MKRVDIAGGLALVACLAFAPAGAQPAASAPAATGANAGGLVEWMIPPQAANPPQSKAEKEQGREHGRTLPTPELLQPSLDPALPGFEPRRLAAATVTVASSDVLPALVHAWIRGFERRYPEVHVRFAPPYEGSRAARMLIAGKIDIAFISREMRPDNVAAFRDKFHYAPLSVPVSGGSYHHYGFLDAVAVFVNKANPVEKLTFAQLDAVFSRTHYRGDKPAKTWGDLGLRGAWADRPIHLYGIKPWNGFEEFVRQRVLDYHGKHGRWRPLTHAAGTVFPIAREVAADPDGIGYSGLAFIDAPVKMLALARAPDPTYYAPTYENVASAKYPLSRVIYANVGRAPGARLAPAVRALLLFVLSRQGQALVRKEGVFLPLRAAQVADSRALLGR